MEQRKDLISILPYLPLVLRGSSLFWPPLAVEALKALSEGPHHSHVDSGEVLFLAVSDIRQSLNLQSLPSSVADGYTLFFDDLMSRADVAKWFGDVVPPLADLLLRLPLLLETHYHNADVIFSSDGIRTGLRVLESQESGIVIMSQELISALIACSFFCLFPITNRSTSHLPSVNSDGLFADLYDCYSEKQENKLKCIIHYFERISSCMPAGNVSFERKVLPFKHNIESNFWGESKISLCELKVFSSGLIEDQPSDALEVDFANKYLGGGVLQRGCVQEEIRFMINPELIAGMFFLPLMEDNEAIEIVGAERFSSYTGYASSFRFGGDYIDKKDTDSMGRRKTKIIAIDALFNPGKRQYKNTYILRETNKAFIGFFNQSKSSGYERLVKDTNPKNMPGGNKLEFRESVAASSCEEIPFGKIKDNLEDEIGIATGNWGCGVFGGDPQLKAMIQWIAASQAQRPFIHYYSFGLEAMQSLDLVSEWILSHGWNVGDLWNMLIEYCLHRLQGKTKDVFFIWLLPNLSSHDTYTHDPMILDSDFY